MSSLLCLFIDCVLMLLMSAGTERTVMQVILFRAVQTCHYSQRTMQRTLCINEKSAKTILLLPYILGV